MTSRIVLVFTVVILLVSITTAGVTGKITGRVTDAQTGEQLVGANIVVEGTAMGAATDENGYYVILNVPPGLYSVRASIIGYADYAQRTVRVEIDLTTTLDFQMKTEVLAGEEVVVIAEKRVIKQDVAASQKSINSNRIVQLPAVNVTDVLGLEAGITSDLGIRGSGRDQALFMVDGVVLRDERDNNPITQIPLSAINEISVQTGGFRAEYHNVRSGVVNVVTKEGNPTYYSGTVTWKYHPPGPKHFGISPFDPDAFWLRPYLDPAVCWTGTANGEPYEDENANGQWDEGEPFTDHNGDGERTYWDEYTRRQYTSFQGWNAVSEGTLNNDDPDDNLTPSAAQQLFRWQHRKRGHIVKPDYDIDAGFGGPVPFVSRLLGNLRFYASLKTVQDMYLIPTNRDGLNDNTLMLKLTSDLSSSMKLTILGLYGETFGTTRSRSGGTSYFTSEWQLASAIDRIGHTLSWRLYTNDYWGRTSVFRNTVSAHLTDVLSPRTYWDVFVERISKIYVTGPGRARQDTLNTELFPGYFVNEAPFGYEKFPVFAIGDGMGMGGSVSTSRDSSTFSTITVRFNLVSQIDERNEISTGLEVVYDHFDLKFGMKNWALPEGNTWTEFSRSPIRSTVFFQDKLEAKGFMGMLGLNVQYVDPNGEWYVLDAYDADFFSSAYSPDKEEQFVTKKAKAHLYVSPRLGISHPITVNSKLYFNYGHYRQMPNSDRLYRIQRGPLYRLDRIGDPTLPLARTISYELGYDHAIADKYLLHLAAYYKDVSQQQDWTSYRNIKGNVNYLKLTNNSYEDIRGLEIDLSKNVGRWLTGNINYEYRVNTWGEFDIPRYYQNPADQRDYLRDNPPTQSKPVPRPRFKANIAFHSPPNFGPIIVGQRVVGGWLFNFIGRWTAGSWFTWNPNNVKGLTRNVQWKAYQNVDLKASKTFSFGSLHATFFLDIYNLLNAKTFSQESFYDKFDFDYYMYSLHLPVKISNKLGSGYPHIPGDDQPGDVRQTGVDFVPIEWINDIEDMPGPEPNNIEQFYPDRELYYYEASTERYLKYIKTYSDGEWTVEWIEADKKRIQEILDTKAYIDMPNQTYFTFLNPRSVFFGLRVSFDLK